MVPLTLFMRPLMSFIDAPAILSAPSFLTYFSAFCKQNFTYFMIFALQCSIASRSSAAFSSVRTPLSLIEERSSSFVATR
jgi:hypothetical protein